MSLKNKRFTIKSNSRESKESREVKRLVVKRKVKRDLKEELPFYKKLLETKDPNLKKYYKTRINLEIFSKKLKYMKRHNLFSNIKKAEKVISNFNKMNNHFLNKFLKIYNNNPKNISKELLKYFEKLNEIVVYSNKVEKIEDLDLKIKSVFKEISNLEIFQKKR